MSRFNEVSLPVPFAPFKSIKDVSNVHSGMFELAENFYKNRSTIENLADGKSKIKLAALSKAQEVLLFDQLFYHILAGSPAYLRQAITRLLTFNHALKYARELVNIQIELFRDLKVVLPVEATDLIKAWVQRSLNGETVAAYGVQSLGIADFRKVETEVCCYVPGEVSHIENIMAKEYKERGTRNLTRTEDTEETEVSSEVEKLSDVTTTEQNKFSTEVASVIDQSRTNNYGGSTGVSTEFGLTKIDIKAYFDSSNTNSSSYSNKQAKEYATGVTNRAMDRMVQKTSEKRTSKIIKEFEETYKHGFDNRNGEKHVTGIYRWLDIIYKNQLINYGKRLMVEFMVPQPAALYKLLAKYKPASIKPNDLTQPPTLESKGISSHEDITEENYPELAREYKVVINNLPKQKLIINETSIVSPMGFTHSKDQDPIVIPVIIEDDSYQLKSVRGSCEYVWEAEVAPRASFKIQIGNYIEEPAAELPFGIARQTDTLELDNVFANYTGAFDIIVSCSKIHSFNGSATFRYELKESAFETWQLQVYNQLLAGYEVMLQQYNDAVEAANENVSESEVGENSNFYGNTNPEMNRLVEQRELKRAAIEMLIQPFGKYEQGGNFLEYKTHCNQRLPNIVQNEAFARYTSMVKFFEQAIDWQLMSYLFYSYFWSDKCDWMDMNYSKSSDPVFEAFLQSGMARVVVPIRLEYTEAFIYYMGTGDVWLGNDIVSGTEDELYMSIAEEMQKPAEGKVETEWETKVPSTLAIIQGKSAYLEEEGLPCCHDEDVINTIIASADTLQIPDTQES